MCPQAEEGADADLNAHLPEAPTPGKQPRYCPGLLEILRSLEIMSFSEAPFFVNCYHSSSFSCFVSVLFVLQPKQHLEEPQFSPLGGSAGGLFVPR